MWWCCGKRGKDQPGCKFSKHESKDDEELGMSDGGPDAAGNMKYVRCLCCKELGHRIDQCIRDPNYKTYEDVCAGDLRIKKIKDFRKLHADTLVNTTHMIKKAVMLPIETDEDGLPHEKEHVGNPF